jgi:NTE family protein
MKTVNLDQPIGLALGSGAARGLAHIGVLKYLEAAGVEVGWIAGSSIGALVGAAYAAGISSREMIQIMEHLDRKRLVKLFSPMISTRGVVSGRSLTSFFESLLGKVRIEDLEIPFCAIATDFHTGRRVIISQGKLADAVRASVSIPVIFYPVRINQQTLVDGGLADPVPVEVVKHMGAGKIIAVSVSQIPGETTAKPKRKLPATIPGAGEKTSHKIPSSVLFQRMSRFLRRSVTTDSGILNSSTSPPTEHLPNMVQAFWQTVAVAEQEITRLHLQVCPPDVVIRPDTGTIQGWEFTRAAEAVEAGECAAKEALEKSIFYQEQG